MLSKVVSHRQLTQHSVGYWLLHPHVLSEFLDCSRAERPTAHKPQRVEHREELGQCTLAVIKTEALPWRMNYACRNWG